ncbi:MAG TPA: hypothetical protein VM055_08205 [Novosphingobium sp.]|nr:hypothetical protein [Novosphingobium sp.]
MSGDAALHDRVEVALARPVVPPIRAFAAKLARDAGARAALFYGSNLRSESLEGVLDFYILTPGEPERGLWPRVSYHEFTAPDGSELRAKVATMTLAMFARAASGELVDTTIWARFVQPSGLAWAADEAATDEVVAAVAQAAVTAARFAVALGPPAGTAEDYWRALFQATYRAEFRIEKPGRENDILGVNRQHFAGLLPLALDAGGIAFEREGDVVKPRLSADTRVSLRRRWAVRRRLGKVYSVVRLVRASTTFDGAARYAAWKVERHTGVPVVVTPWVERHPVLAAPGVLWRVWRARRERERPA